MGSRRSTCRVATRELYAPRMAFWKGPLLGRKLGCRLIAIVGGLRLDDRCERGDGLIVAAEPHHDHALRRTAEPLYVLHRHFDHGARGGDEHHLVPVAD